MHHFWSIIQDIIGISPLQFSLNYLYPNIYQSINHKSNLQSVKDALLFYLNNVASESEIRKLAYNIFNKNESSWEAQLDLLTAHNHLPLQHRLTSAQSTLDNYLIADYNKLLIDTDHILPDIENLQSAINQSRKYLLTKQNNKNKK